MSREKHIDNKNCNGCLHFEACCKWTDFPRQIGFPVCRKFTPTNTPTCTNLHQSYTNLTPTYTNSELEQIEEMAFTDVDILANDINQHCADLAETYCGDTNCLTCLAHALTAKGWRKQSENATDINVAGKSEWISVDEGLPEDDGWYITYTNANGKNNGVIAQQLVTATIRGNKIRRWEWKTRVSPWIVTHWMYLPQPPKGVNNDS